jgi:Tfp pilus assembly protein PilV
MPAVTTPTATRHARGIALTEVMIGACVLALVLGGALLVIQRNYRFLATARDLTIATQILQNETEHLRLANWTAISGYATFTQLKVDPSFTASAQIGQRFTLTRIKTTVQTDLFDLAYTVRWTSPDGKTLKRSIHVQCAKHGLNELFNS